MSMSDLRSRQIQFINSNYQPIFPEVIDGKIATEDFLAASQEVIRMVDKFGKIFAPVKYDMQENVDKLLKKYVADKEIYSTLQDMVVIEIASGGNLIATDALLWLKRGLHMILLFFKKIVNDHKSGNVNEDLVAYLKESYKDALEPYHGWMAQQLFGLLSRMVPKRSQLLQTIADGYEDNEDAIIEKLDIFVQKLKSNITTLESFYKQHL